MDFLRQIEFVQPLWLLALSILPLLGFFMYRTRRHKYPRLLISSLSGLSGGLDWKVFMTKLLIPLKLIALGLLIVAMARPRSLLKEEKIKAEGIDIFLVMDLSSSMLSKDFKPDRLSVAKQVASDFVSDRKYDRFGITIFGGESYTQCPITADHAMVKDFLASIQSGQLEDGTAIGLGLASAVNRLKDSEAKSQVIILLTDGVNTAGNVSPMQAARVAEEFNIKVYTIGVGSMGKALSPVRKRADGTFIFMPSTVEIDENLLRNISSMTGGKYYRATDEDALARVYKEIDDLEKTEIEVTTVKRYGEEYRKFLLIGALLWLLTWLLSETILKIYP